MSTNNEENSEIHEESIETPNSIEPPTLRPRQMNLIYSNNYTSIYIPKDADDIPTNKIKKETDLRDILYGSRINWILHLKINLFKKKKEENKEETTEKNTEENKVENVEKNEVETTEKNTGENEVETTEETEEIKDLFVLIYKNYLKSISKNYNKIFKQDENNENLIAIVKDFPLELLIEVVKNIGQFEPQKIYMYGEKDSLPPIQKEILYQKKKKLSERLSQRRDLQETTLVKGYEKDFEFCIRELNKKFNIIYLYSLEDIFTYANKYLVY
ncbi:2762_t:CDS:2 [Cetraspora pellucida]|uniref:2762_t:CDS:1 n=1 Tax=Cetraspora pellucida TaxID=1433469 RepID=A0ACA9JXG0_9GLOM|nr:2762_t:CDS:2 [Cetraspora pellucida]